MTALLFQLAAIILLRHRLGRTWLRRPVTLLVLASVIYDGVSPVLLAFAPIGQWDSSRTGIQQQYLDSATLIMSGAMLAFTVAYLMTRPEQGDRASQPGDALAAARMLDWRWLTTASVPLAVLTYEGRGYNNGTAAAAGTALSTDLASTFFVLLIALAAFGFLLRHGGRWFLPVLIVQSLVLAAAGERTPVIMDAITVIVLLLHVGIRLPLGQLLAAGALTVAAILAISGSRMQLGRELFYVDSGAGARATALGSGLSSLYSQVPTQPGPGLIAQAAIRLDGPAFAGGILQAEHLGQPRVSAVWVPGSLLVAVPSALWPSKLQHGGDLSPQQLEIDDFGLRQINFLPTFPGIYAGFLSVPWLVLLLAFLGVVAGRGEQWLLRCYTPARLVLLAWAVSAALRYEGGLPTMIVALRAAVVIVAAVKVTEAVRARKARRHAGSPVPVVWYGAGRPYPLPNRDGPRASGDEDRRVHHRHDDDRVI